ncbi:uncharacterized protein LOC106643921 [Copidosoma floridanum]|uniref:uncharacterized protein LOC106643921 n=1 Tax=Copidosoma floridanum TaxID=29053 RepID=UPI0006C98088|nr:uncharacterized protein LOC106643921 [Copidosoma floridanum]
MRSSALESIPIAHRVDQPKILETNGESVSVLGLSWNPKSDKFAFKFTINKLPRFWTKRSLFSQAARYYNPLDPCHCNGALVHLWTDSLNVLHWLNALPSSRQNPADLASRGIMPSQFVAKRIWFHGPDILHETDPQYLELKVKVIEPLPSFNLVSNCSEERPESFVKIPLGRCSRWLWLLRAAAYVMRFAFRCHESLRKSSTPLTIQSTDLELHRRDPFIQVSSPSLTTDELDTASLFLVFDHQQRNFAPDIAVIKCNIDIPIGQQEFLPASSRLQKLAPFLSDGLLRVGGRLSNALLDSDAKHPLILFGRDTLTSLLIQRYHLITLHSGTKLTLSTLRRKYWITNGRQITQLMADLPRAQVTPSPAFQKTGVDYAGRFPIRLAKHRGRGTLKGNIAVFVCMAIRAVHQEVVEDYTADSVIAACQRFTSRRGQCTDLYSDRGINFVGAD